METLRLPGIPPVLLSYNMLIESAAEHGIAVRPRQADASPAARPA
jgi:hypothetical protein